MGSKTPSAWGLAFGVSWGYSWGYAGGGGGSASTAAQPRKKRKRKHQGWLALEAQIKALNTPKQAKTPVLRIRTPQIEPLTHYEEFDGVDALHDELNRIKLELEYKKADAQAKNLAEQDYAAYIQDEEEAVTVLLMLLDYEKAFR